MLPRVDLPEVLLEVHAWTGFLSAFTLASHVKRRGPRRVARWRCCGACALPLPCLFRGPVAAEPSAPGDLDLDDLDRLSQSGTPVVAGSGGEGLAIRAVVLSAGRVVLVVRNPAAVITEAHSVRGPGGSGRVVAVGDQAVVGVADRVSVVDRPQPQRLRSAAAASWPRA